MSKVRNMYGGKFDGLLRVNDFDVEGPGTFKNRQVGEKNIAGIRADEAHRTRPPRKVLLIPARIDTARFLSLGIGCLAGYLRKEGHEVTVWEELPTTKKSLEEVVRKFGPDVVGFSTMTSQFTKGLELAYKVKEVRPDVPIIFGGVHPTAAPKETLLQNEMIDFVCVGEGEYTMTEFLDHLDDREFEGIKGLGYKDEGGVHVNSSRGVIRDLDSLPMPARDLFDMDYYRQRWNWPRGMWLSTANVMSSRGCPFDCTFCASKVMFGRGFKPRSVENTMAEVEYLLDTYGFNCISFSDDTFAIQKQRAMEIGREFKRRNLKAVFRVQLRVDTCDADLIEALKEGGLIHVDFGIESGSEKILASLKKGFRTEDVYAAIDTVKKHKISVGATFIIGSISETLADVEETRNLARKIGADYTQFFIMTPYPGTELWDYARERNLMFENITYEHFRHGGVQLQPFMKVELTSDGLIRMQDDLNNEFVNRTIRKYLRHPRFLADLGLKFVKEPSSLGRFVETYATTFNVGKALKAVMPHNL